MFGSFSEMDANVMVDIFISVALSYQEGAARGSYVGLANYAVKGAFDLMIVLRMTGSVDLVLDC
jgi:hypothetical protein